ncbi:MAG: hypothetical protein LIP28_11155 [Deltaproteobacteria bacterium]|nr:hypothetical protein [Deltaproteobacteria bacterium]
MSNPEHIAILTSEPLTLFVFNQSSTQTVLRLSAKQTVFKRSVEFRDQRGQSTARRVRFKLCGLDLSDSFSALSRVHSLVKLFVHRQFGIGDKSMVIAFPTPNDQELLLYCRVVPYKDAYEGMEIGWLTVRDDERIRKSHTMPIAYVHDFQSALHKAMGWISPGLDIEYVELPEARRNMVPQPKKEPREPFVPGFYSVRRG